MNWRKRPSAQNQQYSVRASQDLSAKEADIQQPSTPHGKQNEEVLSNVGKRQKIQALSLSPRDHWKLDFNAGASSRSESGEWRLPTSNIGTSRPFSQLGGFDYQAYHQPMNPTTPQSSHFFSPGWYDIPSAGVNGFPKGDHASLPPAPEYNLLSLPNKHSGSSSANSDASSPVWPSILNGPQGSHSSNQWPGRHNFQGSSLESTAHKDTLGTPDVPAFDDFQSAPKTDSSPSASHPGSDTDQLGDVDHFVSQFLVDYDNPHDAQNKPNAAKGGAAKPLEPLPSVTEPRSPSPGNHFSSEPIHSSHSNENHIDEDDLMSQLLEGYATLHEESKLNFPHSIASNPTINTIENHRETPAPTADFASDLSNLSHANGVHIDEDHLTSELLKKVYTDHHGGEKQDNPRGVAPNAVPPILPDMDNHRQTHAPIVDLASKVSYSRRVKDHHVDEDHLMSDLLEGYAILHEQNKHNYPHGIMTNSLQPHVQNIENHSQTHAPITHLGSEVSSPRHNGDHVDEDDFVSNLFVDYDNLHNENDRKDSHHVRFNSQEPVVQVTEDHREAPRGSNPSQSNEVYGYHPDSQLPVHHDNRHDEHEKNAVNEAVEEVRKDDRNERRTMTPPDNSLELLKDQLTAAAYPRKSMSREFLQTFTKRFTLEIRKRFEANRLPTLKPTNRKMAGYPAVMCPSTTNDQLSIIRVLDNSDGSGYRTKMGDKLSQTFNKLICWLIFAHMALLRNASGEPNLIAESLAHEKLMDWLFKEAFHPSGGSFPVVGAVETASLPKDGKAFGPMQADLLEYLSQDSSIERLLKVSVSIIHEYINKNPGTVHLLEDKAGLTRLLQSAISKATASQEKADNPDQLRYLHKVNSRTPIQLKHFLVPRLSDFPLLLVPTRFAGVSSVTLGKYEALVLKTFVEQSRIPSSSTHAKYPMDDLPVILETPMSLDNEKTPIKFTVRIVHLNWKTIQSDHMVLKIKSLFFHLQLCHHHLLDYIQNSVQIKPIDRAHKSFSKWLTQVILKPLGDRSYPLFGQVEAVRCPDTFKPSHFDEVQIELIDYFTEPKSHFVLFRLSLTLIGYWYRNHPTGDHLTRYFKTDDLYWETMLDLLYKRVYSKRLE
ncbi:uncharacterized protein PGTG_04230 [Puccinia graminis f. sp. tritici CRL 75-36-700-3]|uniref:Uncharacterized protein n=1 Tax=Puccinia graminis f. sp. tritici (strain CRL 75-36-700-3 / race SCCL) TaxID=418459 RepID=E3K1U9_PUCGT|nr:uncharacterized protein PGTG_04230 [Puccinia graminis f. sp. tritici CRL 75-36-700-3]EFP78274.2 hypothetical protein PGTG_04230 [Puccinia graminis f. sp. tritici CRL 75-36-700-3]